MPNETTGKQLNQLRPGDTNAVSIYSPSAAEIVTEIRLIHICNTTTSNATFRLFHDEDGTTYDETTALIYDKTVLANDFFAIGYEEGEGIWLQNTSGNLAIRSGTSSALTFTIYGIENISDLDFRN